MPGEDDELKALVALYAVVSYALRELRALSPHNRDVENGLAAAQAALFGRIGALDAAVPREADQTDPKEQLH